MVSIGDKVWVWHYQSLKEIEVEGITELNGLPSILYPGCITTNFFKSKYEAVENRLEEICSLVNSLNPENGRKTPSEQQNIIKNLIFLAEKTQKSIKKDEEIKT